eukprot:3182836-Amphidinium_carterae.1
MAFWVLPGCCLNMLENYKKRGRTSLVVQRTDILGTSGISWFTKVFTLASSRRGGSFAASRPLRSEVHVVLEHSDTNPSLSPPQPPSSELQKNVFAFSGLSYVPVCASWEG